jgi:hypothetical protein
MSRKWPENGYCEQPYSTTDENLFVSPCLLPTKAI